jgi:hypothetical protein
MDAILLREFLILQIMWFVVILEPKKLIFFNQGPIPWTEYV